MVVLNRRHRFFKKEMDQCLQSSWTFDTSILAKLSSQEHKNISLKRKKEKINFPSFNFFFNLSISEI